MKFDDRSGLLYRVSHPISMFESMNIATVWINPSRCLLVRRILLHVDLRELNPFCVSNRRSSHCMNAVKSIRDRIDSSANPAKVQHDDKKKIQYEGRTLSNS